MKEPGRIRAPAPEELLRRSGCARRENEIFNARPRHFNDGFRPTAVDDWTAPSARTTPSPILSPLTIRAPRAQLICAAQDRVRRVGARKPRIGRREGELSRSTDGTGRSVEALGVLASEEGSIWVLGPVPAPMLLCCCWRTPALSYGLFVVMLAFDSPWSTFV